jgi:hypothetical protein
VILEELMNDLERFAKATYVPRSPANYDRFLRLYEQVGYAPADDQERGRWRARSIETWTKLDERLAGTYTGGGLHDELASAVGTLPISPTIVYGHSFCMIKTLEAGATMYSQALNSLDWMDRISSAEYWAGSYAYGKRFVVLFQRPRNLQISGQIELETLRCYPTISTFDTARANFHCAETTPEHEASLYPNHQLIYRQLTQAHPMLKGLHSVTRATVFCERTERPLAIALVQDSLPEFTAIDMFAAPWIFPLRQTEVSIDELRFRLRGIPKFFSRRLEIVLPSSETHFAADHGEKLLPAFWAFTPRESIPALRQSLRAAFETLLVRYSDEDLTRFGSAISQA